MNEIIDADGNVIRKGMAVVSGGEIWVVGSIHYNMIRLDNGDGPYFRSRLIGRRKMRMIHIIGYQIPLVF
jgi:hypothetical protein